MLLLQRLQLHRLRVLRMKISLKQLRTIIQEEVSLQAGATLNEATDIDKLTDMAVGNANTIGEILRRLTALEDKAK